LIKRNFKIYMSLLIIGGTGTLGRQIVLQALTKGYRVRCLVRNLRKANFLKEWGAELIYGDLILPETIPPCLKGITAIIDASTTRPNDLTAMKKIDWDGKLALIEAAKVAGIKHFIFCSALNAEQFSFIPLMKMKKRIEIYLKKSDISFTIFRLTGFYQALIQQYAIPILEGFPIWITDEQIDISYIDTQDIARFCVRSLQLPKTKNKVFILEGPKRWLSLDIIKLCEQLAGQSSNVNQIPIFILKLFTNVIGYFEWGQNISDRLRFVEILNNKNTFSNSKVDLYQIFKIDINEILNLEDYFLEYFIRLLKRLKDINFEDIQKQKNLIL
jgi:NmrA-like family.